MVYDVVGVVEDGSTRASFLPTNTRQTLKLPLATDVTIRLSVYYASGVPVDLSSLSTGLLLTIKKHLYDTQAQLALTGAKQPTEGRHRANFVVVPDDTLYLEPGQYTWDVNLTIGGKREPVIPLSPLRIVDVAGLP